MFWYFSSLFSCFNWLAALPMPPPTQPSFISVCNSAHNAHTLRCGFKVLACLANISAETICSAVTLIAKITARQQTLFGGIGDKITARSRRRLQRGADAPLIWCCNGHYPAQRCGMQQQPGSCARRRLHGAAKPARIHATPGPFPGCGGAGQSRTGGRGWQSCVGRLGCRKGLLKW